METHIQQGISKRIAARYIIGYIAGKPSIFCIGIQDRIVARIPVWKFFQEVEYAGYWAHILVFLRVKPVTSNIGSGVLQL
jgi:hypothetical protein